MSRYLDPKADVVFKKIFGEHPHLLKSFLNALLPLPEDGAIDTLEYLSPEHVPVIPAFKSTMVDVKCKDRHGRVFIVEMQIDWIASFMQRMLFGASTAYVRQLKPGEHFHMLQPVYGLGLIGSVFERQNPNWYHHYQLVNLENPQRVIKDLQLVFIELPKFKPITFTGKKLQLLWLRFMSELNWDTKRIPEEWLTVPEIKEAVELTEEASYSPGELDAYESYWKAVSSEKTLVIEKFQEGQKQGQKQTQQEIAKNLFAMGLDKDRISQATGIPLLELEAL